MEIEDLPLLALDAIVEFLDYPSRRITRLVSTKLKKYADFIGLSIKIDSRQAGSIAFSQSVAATEVRIFYLKACELDEESMRRWKTAILSGPVDISWMNNSLLKHCCFLRVLIINDTALVAEDFGNPSADQPPVFQHLTQLHISLSDAACQKAMWNLSAARLHLILNMNRIKILRRVNENLVYFLSQIRSHALKVLFISVDTCDMAFPDLAGRFWEQQPLFEFLQTHRQSIETIALPSLTFGNTTAILQFQKPIHVKQLKIGTKTGSNHGLSNYWTDMLLEQRSLEKFNLCDRNAQLTDGDGALLPWLKSLATMNSTSLTEVEIRFNIQNQVPEELAEIDLGLFSDLLHLKKLRIRVGIGNLKIHNLNQLPRNLTDLDLQGTGLEIGPGFDAMKFLDDFSLNSLLLKNISDSGPFGDPALSFNFLMRALRIRTLNFFGFVIGGAAHLGNPWFDSSVQVSESFLNLWVTQLKAESHWNPTAVLFRVCEVSEVLRREPDDVPDPDYVGCHICETLDYMNILSWKGLPDKIREQPFNLPKDSDSFLVWVNQKANTYQILPNRITHKYALPTGVRFISKITIDLLFVKNANSMVECDSLKEMGVPESKILSLNSPFIHLRFGQPGDPQVA